VCARAHTHKRTHAHTHTHTNLQGVCTCARALTGILCFSPSRSLSYSVCVCVRVCVRVFVCVVWLTQIWGCCLESETLNPKPKPYLNPTLYMLTLNRGLSSRIRGSAEIELPRLSHPHQLAPDLPPMLATPKAWARPLQWLHGPEGSRTGAGGEKGREREGGGPGAGAGIVDPVYVEDGYRTVVVPADSG
jgi:hypothetical protein